MTTSRWSQPGLLALCVIAIGGGDYLSGPAIGFSLFYLAPIIWGAWYGERGLGVALALLASLFWIAADVAWVGVTAISMWNGFTRLGIYVAMAVLISRVRDDQRALRALNARLQEHLEHEQHLARTDPLTGLPNRRLFLDELRRSAARIHRTSKPVAVAYLDLDGFKTFNDRMGHSAGDAVLKRVANVLLAHVRGTDVPARLGGAQFGILLDRCTEDSARKTAIRIVDQLSAALKEVANPDVGLSVGVACFEDDSLAPEAMIDHADAAMYCAKGQGLNRIYVTRLGPSGPRVAVQQGAEKRTT
jgi:diguanylate cyclase (GGDEF)-like protein